MSIDTIYESLNLFFRKNEDVLKLPIEVDFGKDVRNALSNRWAQYVDLIKNHNCLEECIPIIEKSISFINASIDAWLTRMNYKKASILEQKGQSM